MGKVYVDTGGATGNSGSRDEASAHRSGSNATVSGSVVTLDGSPDLTTIITSGANQDSILLSQATNSNRRIFWITAVDNGAKTVTVDVAPTGVTGSAWTIGGRHVWTKASIEGGLRAGDEVIFNNSPASDSGALLTSRANGDEASGRIRVRGAAGSRPLIQGTGILQTVSLSSHNGWAVSNLELANSHASGTPFSMSGTGGLCYNLKISDSGGAGLESGFSSSMVVGCEIGGGSITTGIASAVTTGIVHGNYIHDISSHGMVHNNQFNPGGVASFNILDTCGGNGIRHGNTSTTFPTAPLVLLNNTIYGCGDSGLEVIDGSQQLFVVNNILSENGNAAGEYNVEYLSTNEAISFHAWNVFHHSGGGGGGNLNNLSVNADVASSEFTTDPLFADAAGGNFAIGSSSPAKAAGYPGLFLG